MPQQPKQKPQPRNVYLPDEINRRKSMANTKLRFWRIVILLFVAFAGYVIYLNVVGFRPRASAKKSPAQFAEQQQHNPLVDVAEHQQQKSPDDAGFAQPVKAPSSGSPEKLKAVVLNSIPHDTAAFTQGLFYDDEAGDHFIECTGLYGRSSIRRLRVADGKVVHSRLLSDSSWFGEGCFRARAGVGVMMTWQNQVAFEFNTTTFEEIRRFPWPREGWGISGDGGNQVFATDGSNSLFSLHPSTYADVASTRVKVAMPSGIQTSRLNEIELIDDEVLANVWGDNYILRINPKTGWVTAIIECQHLRPESSKSDGNAVLNGIAWDAVGRRLWLTGKLWPVIYQVELQPM